MVKVAIEHFRTGAIRFLDWSLELGIQSICDIHTIAGLLRQTNWFKGSTLPRHNPCSMVLHEVSNEADGIEKL
jgi:hypothetical protein